MKKKENLKKVIMVVLLLCLIVQSQKSVFADTERTALSSANAGTTQCTDTSSVGEMNPIVPLTQENIKNFMDQYFKDNMAKWNVPGAAVAVVKNGKELYKAGYGVSDMESQQAVDPDSTTFPAGSVSKLFTATAIMQLYQSGKLNLNKNIQTYLDDISIENPFHEEITCQNLLTHSNGLDEQSELDGSTLDKTAIESQKQYFEEHIPTVIIQPNTVCRYSNMGYNLLGYVVEKVSGETYENYVTNHILTPLHMQQSSVRIENDSMAKGYNYEDGQYQKMPFAYQYTSGSSGVISTVSDMENFMIMHLNRGTYQDTMILDSATEAFMQKKQFANNEVFEGMGEGFIRGSWNGVQILKHEGALPGYTTTVLLIPGQDLGIYVATNSLGGMVFDFEEAFSEYFFGPANAVNTAESATSTDTATSATNQSYNKNKYIGTYRSYDGISKNTISKMLAVVDSGAEFTIEKSDSGELTVSYYAETKEKVKTNLIYQSDGVFLREDGKGYITFREDSNGNTIYAFNNISHQTYMREGGFETSGFIGVELLCLMSLLFVSAIVIIIKQILHKQKRNNKLWLINALINIGYVLSFVGIFVLECYMILNYDYHFISMIYILLTVLLVAMISNLIEIFVVCHGIIKKKFDIKTIVTVVVIQIAQILFVITMYYLNMVGYHIF